MTREASIALECIRKILERKREACIEPSHALLIQDNLLMDVCVAANVSAQMVPALLEELEAEGYIESGPTIRDTYYRECRIFESSL